MKIFLDGFRKEPVGFTKVTETAEAEKLLATGMVEHLSLDFNLGKKKPTGYDLILWMAATGHWPNEGIQIHSNSLSAFERMKRVINQYSPFQI